MPSRLAIGNPGVRCKNPKCDTVYYASTWGLHTIISMSEGASYGSHKGHLVTCSYDHAYYDIVRKKVKRPERVSQPNPYWSCPPNYPGYPKRNFHVKLCGGTCGLYNVFTTSDFKGWSAGEQLSYEPHWVPCNENVKREASNMFKKNCLGYYYTCAGVGSCWNADKHITPTVSAPVWSNIPDPYYLRVGDRFRLDLRNYVTGSPTLKPHGGKMPAGLSFRNGVISGRVTSVESQSIRYRAQNPAGVVSSEWIDIRIRAAR